MQKMTFVQCTRVNGSRLVENGKDNKKLTLCH